MNFFTFKYWFSYYSEPFLPIAAKLVFFWFTVTLLAGLIIRYLTTREKDRFVKKLMFRLYHLFVAYAVIGFFFFFLTQQQIPLFGARFWYVLLDIGALVWVVLIIRNYKKTVPVLRQKAKERAAFEKYLP